MKWNLLMQLERRKLKRNQVKDVSARGIALVSTILVIYLGVSESVGSSPLWNQVDKGMHFSLFGAFTFVFMQYARFKLFLRQSTAFRTAVILGGLLVTASIAEAVHKLIPSRTFDWWDMAANFAGVLVIGVPVAIITPLRQSHDQFTNHNHRSSMTGFGKDTLRIRKKPGRRAKGF